jgi:hypothetical protein
MRELTPPERQTLEKRRLEFDKFVQEAAPVLSDFAKRLGLENPQSIAVNPEAFLEPIDDFMKDQVIMDDDRIWIVARLAYFIGQILIQRFGGEWLLNERPDSRFFLQYVVGRFPSTSNPNVTIDPLRIASEFLAAPSGRSLERTITEAIEEFLTHR